MDDHHELGEDKAAAQGAAVGQTLNIAECRIERLQDLYAAAVEEPDPLRANVRAATADLLEITYRLGTAIKARMGSGETGLEAYQETVMPAIGTLGLLHRQATRYVQLDRDWASE
jgi:hypothetical protein